MTAAVVSPERVHEQTAVEILCSGRGAEDLFYAWINAVIYEMATRRMLFARFDVTVDGDSLRATAFGEPVSVDRHQPAVEVKGATYTTLKVSQGATNGWAMRRRRLKGFGDGHCCAPPPTRR